MKDLDLLVGRKILSAKINDEYDLVVLETDKGPLNLSWYGDCCAHCYLAHVSGSDELIGSTVLSVENTKWNYIRNTPDLVRDECSDVTENMGTSVKTNSGYITFETRLEHNGYYGGTINITEESIETKHMSSLKDF